MLERNSVGGRRWGRFLREGLVVGRGGFGVCGGICRRRFGISCRVVGLDFGLR